jgi:hypothetical protein
MSGVNKVNIKLSISIPIIIRSSDLKIIIPGFTATTYTYNIVQSQSNLSAL